MRAKQTADLPSFEEIRASLHETVEGLRELRRATEESAERQMKGGRPTVFCGFNS